MTVTAIHHAGFIVTDLARARAFYEDVLGLSPLPRPALPYPGAWYAIGSQQLHLMNLPDPDAASVRPAHGGRDRHLALACSDLAALRARLDAAGAAYSVSQSGRAALFCRDPDGNTLECVAL